MDLETTVKYLEFVSSECQRHLDDKVVTDDELFQLITEYNLFKERVAESKLPEEIKTEIADLEFTFSYKKVERGSHFIFMTFITLGIWAFYVSWRRRIKRVKVLRELGEATYNLSYKIRLNY